MDDDSSVNTNTDTGDQMPGAGVPDNQKSGWSSFLKSIATVSGDLSSLTAPSFILSPVSLVEYTAYWGEHPDVFVAPAQEADPEKRFLLVLKWFIATLKGQFAARKNRLGSEKKPFNPILGEEFHGYWADHNDIGKTVLVTEQVSHHPPITAYHINNIKNGVELGGFTAQKSGFNGRYITVKQVGHAVYTLNFEGGNKKEHYLVSLPSLQIEGLWYGSPYLELVKTSYIASSTGYLATIEYSGKGFFSGKRNSFKAKVTRVSEPLEVLYIAHGQWIAQSSLMDPNTGEVLEQVWWDADKEKTQELTVAPVSDQRDMESRRIWETTANAIRNGEYDVASKEKTRVENAERKKRKNEKENGEMWKQKFFDHVEKDPVFDAVPTNGLITDEDGWIFKQP